MTRFAVSDFARGMLSDHLPFLSHVCGHLSTCRTSSCLVLIASMTGQNGTNRNRKRTESKPMENSAVNVHKFCVRAVLNHNEENGQVTKRRPPEILRFATVFQAVVVLHPRCQPLAAYFEGLPLLCSGRRG